MYKVCTRDREKSKIDSLVRQIHNYVSGRRGGKNGNNHEGYKEEMTDLMVS